MVEMRVLTLGQVQGSEDPILVLQEVGGDRLLVIGIGRCEATAIAIALQGIQVGRPLTHDLLHALMSRLHGKLRSVVIHDLQQDTFIGELEVDTPSGVIEVDCRPSDAIALALRADAPILVSEDVLAQAAIRPEPPAEDTQDS